MQSRMCWRGLSGRRWITPSRGVAIYRRRWAAAGHPCDRRTRIVTRFNQRASRVEYAGDVIASGPLKLARLGGAHHSCSPTVTANYARRGK